VVYPQSVDTFIHFALLSKIINSRYFSKNTDRFFEERFSFFEVKHKQKLRSIWSQSEFLDTSETRKIETDLYVNGTSDFVSFTFTQNVKAL